MKISKLFHWLYAFVMFLPLLVIPIFAIYTINHEPTPLVIEREEKVQVNFNQLNQNPIPTSSQYYSSYNTNYSTLVFEDNSLSLTTNYQGNVANYLYGLVSNTPSDSLVVANHKVVMRFNIFSENHSSYLAYCGQTAVRFNITLNQYNFISLMFTPLGDNSRLIAPINTTESVNFKISYWQYFDLTVMFGEGNEPTLTEFNALFPNSYYEYTLNEPIYISRGVVQYDDTDIGSQYLYALYHTTDKYFNFDDVLNLGAITDWLDSNVFNGSTPLSFTIVWHYLDYWLIVSIFWLCFDVLIYVPQLAHRWLDKASLE